MALPPSTNHHLPPHLREVCALLARGVLRLRSRAAEEAARAAESESAVRLHTVPGQRLRANPRRKGVA
jgi:hypothetical protein